MKKQVAFAAALAAGITAQAATVYVSGDITNSTVWTSDNVYTMTNQVFVLPGASLKIEAGTHVMSDEGSLAVCRGAQIFILGTSDNPVIMTSTSDDLVTYRSTALEWGNLTVMGNALISATTDGTGTGEPDGTDDAPMEGLTAAYPGDPNVRYGGNNDDDDSGTIQYVSFRYGGKVLGLGNELNGLSMGGIGRGTDVHHVEIMNNVDDGIETWGGTVNYKYVSIWNVGDDSFDIDQGWRGKAQFGLIVQGYSLDAKQGSGIGDNCMEMDGAEVASAQPVGTAQFYNFTVIGQPGDFNPGGDQGTEWRDGMRAQIRNSIFMDIGDKLFKNAISDNEHGTMGYGIDGVPTLESLFATPFNSYPTNSIGVNPVALYPNFFDGNMAELKSCVFYNLHETGSITDTNYNIMADGNMNILASELPIQGIERGATVSLQSDSYDMMPVTFLNPCAANDAVTTSMMAPNDGFYTPASYKGAFSPNYNWLAGWSAADAYGMTDTSMNNLEVPSASLGLGAAVSFQSDAGVSYDIEATDNLTNGWMVVDTVVGDGSVKTYVDTYLPSAQYYRVVITP